MLALGGRSSYSAAALAPAATHVASVGSGRGVAQPGRALSSGGRGRRFESSLPDHRLRQVSGGHLKRSRSAALPKRKREDRSHAERYLNPLRLSSPDGVRRQTPAHAQRGRFGLRARGPVRDTGPRRSRPRPLFAGYGPAQWRRALRCRRWRAKLARWRLRQAPLGKRRRPPRPASTRQPQPRLAAALHLVAGRRRWSASSRVASAPRPGSARPS